MNTARSSVLALVVSLAGCAAYYPQPASVAYGYGYGYGYAQPATVPVYPVYTSPAVVYGGYRGPAFVRDPHEHRERTWQPRGRGDHDRGHDRHERRG